MAIDAILDTDFVAALLSTSPFIRQENVLRDIAPHTDLAAAELITGLNIEGVQPQRLGEELLQFASSDITHNLLCPARESAALGGGQVVSGLAHDQQGDNVRLGKVWGTAETELGRFRSA